MISRLSLLLAATSLAGAFQLNGLSAPQIYSQKGFSPVLRISRAAGICSTVMMGKGKGTPIQYRGEMQKRQQMQQMQQQLAGSDGSDGFPVFALYVRSKVAKFWYPCGSLKGDGQAKNLVEAWMNNSLFLKDQYKSTLNKGMAKSVFSERKKLVDSVVRVYPQLKKSQQDLEFGFKVRMAGLDDKLLKEERKAENEIVVLEEEMTKGWLDGLKGAFNLG